MTENPGVPKNEGFDEIMRCFPPALQTLAYRARDLIYEIYPDVIEVLWIQ